MQIEQHHQFSDVEVARTLYPWGLVETRDPAPFDLNACISQYVAGLPARPSFDAHPWRDDFTRKLSGKRGVVSDAEARFWFVALTDVRRLDEHRGEPGVDRLADFDPDAEWDVAARFDTWITSFTARYRNVRLYSQAYLARLMLQLLGLERTLQALLTSLPVTWLSVFLDELYPTRAEDNATELAQIGESWFAQQVGPMASSNMTKHLTDVDNAKLRLLPLTRPSEAVRQYLTAARKTPPKSEAALYHVLNAEPDDTAFLEYLESYRPDLGRREVVLLLGRFGFDGCDWICRRVRASRRVPEEGLVGALAKVRSPAIVPALLHLADQTTTANEARAALVAADLQYAVGLVEAAAGRTKDRETAADLLAQVERADAHLVAEAVALQPEAVRGAVAERMSSTSVDRRPELPAEQWPGWMTAFHNDQRPRGLPRFCSDKHLRPIFLADAQHEVPARVVAGMLVSLRDHAWTGESRVFGANIRVDLDVESASAAFWSMFESWTRSGFPAAHTWCMYAVSEFASDAQILAFAAQLETWPTLGESRRAYDALRVLEIVGSDTALAALNKIAKTSKFKGLRTRAQHALTRLATKQGITPGQLEDLLIDDCGLDPDGTAVFDYGTRTFRLAFDPGLAPVVRDESGARSKSLPRPRKSDDPALVEQERRRFNTMKKRLRDVLGLQSRRLESALAEQRRWDVGKWRNQYVVHPVMRHLVQRLLWAEYEDGRATRLFRVTAEGGFASVDDDDLHPNTGARVGLVHPLDVRPEDLDAWGSVFADYEIIPPFPQLDREVYEAQTAAATIVDLADVELDSGWVRGHFNRRGWSKSAPEGERIHSVYRDFHASEIRAYAKLDPGLRLDYRKDSVQHIRAVWFVARQDWREGTRMRTNAVPRVVFSEALYDVRLMVDRARAGNASSPE